MNDKALEEFASSIKFDKAARETALKLVRDERPLLMGEAPKLCMAISGGGLRSAAFSQGVLRRLHNDNLTNLDDWDYLSTVSGGGYTGAWYYSMKNADKASSKALFAADGKYQEFLAKRSRDFLPDYWGVWTAATAPALNAFWAPVRWVSGGNNTFWPTAGFFAYQASIHNSWLVTPNDGIFSSYDPKLHEIRQAVTDLRLPYPLVNVSVFPGSDPPCSNNRSALNDAHAIKYLAQATPDGLSSLVLGRTSWEKSQGFIDIITASASAIDHPEERNCNVKRNLFGLNTGLWAREVEFKADAAVTPQSVFADVFISDGGFVENLGLVPLIFRQCEKILVIDAEHDPGEIFSSYWKAKRAVENHGFSLAVNEIEAISKINQERRCAIADRSPDTNGIGEEAKCFQARTMREQVFEGSVTAGEARKLSLLYIKLGMNDRARAQYGSDVQSFVGDEDKEGRPPGCTGKGLSERCSFPQQSTSIQAYSEPEWRAYVGLGEDSVRLNSLRIKNWLKRHRQNVAESSKQ